MSRRRRGNQLDEAKGDMTSMIDVVFLLLIFFIVMPIRTPEARIESHLPKNSGPDEREQEEDDPEKIDIKIKRNGQAIDPSTFSGIDIKLNGRQISFPELRGHLTGIKNKIRGELNKVPVELNADEDVPFTFVMNAMDSAKLTGFTYIKFPEASVLNSGKKPRRY